MNTERLFRDDVYMKETVATITSVTEHNGNTLITLDKTVFFPTGGGQSCDKGTINGIPVIDVYEHNNEIFHQLGPITGGSASDSTKSDTKVANASCENEVSGTLTVGQQVNLSLDWEHRFDNMQRHCGEHILSGIFFREFGGVNRGFHMGDQYMTIDISLEAAPEYDKITWEMAKHVELEANKVIWQNLPVITRHFNRKEEAENLPLRKALAIEEDITIVCVGSVENPSDCVACCGTHPSTAGQVGLIKLYKVESNKGMFRIYFEAGQRAFQRLTAQFDTMTSLENSLSAGFDDVLDKYKSQREKNRETRTNLYLLKKEVVKREVSDITDCIATSQSPVVREYEIISPDDISAIARELGDAAGKILFLIHKPTLTVFLCSDGKQSDCGKLVKENASIYGGKGGGNKTFARAIFSKEEYIPTFIDLIEKHLR